MDGPTGWRLRAAARRAPTVLGALLVCLGSLVVLPLIVLTISVVIYLIVWIDFHNHPEKVWPEWFDKIRGDLVPLWLAALAIVMFCVIAGLKLLRRNRNVILFLRRFGYRPATDAVTQATLRVGDFWRVVTLDDDKIESLGAGEDIEQLVDTVGKVKHLYGRARPVVVKVWRLTMQTAVAVLVIALAVVISPGPDWEARFERLRALVDLDKSPDGVAPLAARIAAGVIAVGIGLFALWIVAVFVVWVLSFPVRLVYSGVSRGVQEASRAEQLHIANELDIFTAQHTVDRQRQKVFGARLCVLAVDSSVWQQTVAGMADVCAVPLIDISEPTENVMWEINELVARFGDRCVFIGDFGRLQHLAAGDEGGVIERLSTFLTGCDVLGYEVDPEGTKRFIHALSSTLAWHARQPRPTSRVPVSAGSSAPRSTAGKRPWHDSNVRPTD